MKKILTKQNLKRFLRGVLVETGKYLMALMYAVWGSISLAVLTNKDALIDFLIETLTANFVVYMVLVGFLYGFIELIKIISLATQRDEEPTNANATVETI